MNAAVSPAVGGLVSEAVAEAINTDFFLDTNILIYATSLSPDHATKAPAARRLGAGTVVSEDMEHGRDYEGVTVLNPFRSGD